LFYTDEKVLPEFPLIPASRGFCITLGKTLAMFKEVLIKENIIQRPSEWQNNENATMELTNGIANQCQEISKSVNNKMTECNENSSGNIDESNKKPISSNNQSMKEATSVFATNGLAAASSETKKNTSSQNTS